MAHQSNQPLNLDSFLDLLSNTVGALILVLILTLVMGGSVCIQPVEPTRRTIRYFVSRGERITELPVERLKQGGGDTDWALERRWDCTVFLPRRTALGETIEELLADHSRFRRALSAFHPDGEAIFVMVFADSFEVFRVARQVAREHQMQLGWWPVTDEVRLCAEGVEPLVPRPGGGR